MDCVFGMCTKWTFLFFFFFTSLDFPPGRFAKYHVFVVCLLFFFMYPYIANYILLSMSQFRFRT